MIWRRDSNRVADFPLKQGEHRGWSESAPLQSEAALARACDVSVEQRSVMFRSGRGLEDDLNPGAKSKVEGDRDKSTTDAQIL